MVNGFLSAIPGYFLCRHHHSGDSLLVASYNSNCIQRLKPVFHRASIGKPLKDKCIRSDLLQILFGRKAPI